jgi:hypothetical protein
MLPAIFRATIAGLFLDGAPGDRGSVADAFSLNISEREIVTVEAGSQAARTASGTLKAVLGVHA